MLRAFITYALAVVLLGGISDTASAAPLEAAEDRLEMVSVKPGQIEPGTPGPIRFKAALDYQLESAQRGYLLLFYFENEAQTAEQNNSEKFPVSAGPGQLDMEIDYEPRPGVRTVRLAIGLFTEDQRLLTWAGTTEVPLATWYARSAFESAMTERDEGRYDRALELLSRAIQVLPDTGNFYYWRADTLIRQEQYEQAAADYSRALTLMPQDRPSRVGRGVAYLWLKQLQLAHDDLSLVIADGSVPDRWTAQAYLARGRVYVAADRHANAAEDFRAYLALAPDAPDRDEVEGWIARLD